MIAASALVAAATLVATPPARPEPARAVDANTGQPIPCRCRYGGRLYEVGQTACLNLPEGRRQARCERFDNVTTWAVVGEGCGDVSRAVPVRLPPAFPGAPG